MHRQIKIAAAGAILLLLTNIILVSLAPLAKHSAKNFVKEIIAESLEEHREKIRHDVQTAVEDGIENGVEKQREKLPPWLSEQFKDDQ